MSYQVAEIVSSGMATGCSSTPAVQLRARSDVTSGLPPLVKNTVSDPVPAPNTAAGSRMV
jgi:hypothetical protein